MRFGCPSMLLLALLAAANIEWNSASEEVYVTLLYGDEFLLGVRVLGKSIRDTGATRDMVVLVSDGVSDYGKRLLQSDGWVVKPISLLANPNLRRPKRFWGVYTKLKIFSLTMYKKVVYLDADTIVVKSIEDLFKCGKFCANLKHSERLNSGVMVVEPSESVFKDMMDKVSILPSYTGGDQGFLNSYFEDFANAHLFEPNLTSEERNSRGVQKMERLSTLYNADVGLYMLANKWMVDERELRVIHYTLGPLKPWDWWTSWLLKPVDVWQNVRETLEESLPGTAGGTDYREQLLVKVLFFIPLCFFFFIFFRSRYQIIDGFYGFRSYLCDYSRRGLPLYSSAVQTSVTNSSNKRSSWIHPKIPTTLAAISILVCFMSAFVSLGLSFALIPRQVMPWTGLLLMYAWTFLGFFILFGAFLQLVYRWGRSVGALSYSQSETETYDSGKAGHQRQSSSEMNHEAWFYGLGMAFLAVAAPSLPYIFGITALFARLALMVGAGMMLSAFMTYASEKMAFNAFIKGLNEHDHPRTRAYSQWI